ncbi:hypothetical protein Tco_0985303 [Tanacetum coccineum]
MRTVWKPTGKVFTEIGYSWKPTGRIFTIVGNRFPLTRITSTKEVPLKKSTITSVIIPSPELKVYSRKLKASRSIGSNSKVVQIVLCALCYPTNDGEDLVPAIIAPEPVVSTGTPSSTTIDQDAPSISCYSKQCALSQQPPEHINKWTKDHPIDNVIGDPSRPVSTRHQLQDEALLCYFDTFLSSVEPKSYKEALTESSWIEAMQKELNEFKLLEV